MYAKIVHQPNPEKKMKLDFKRHIERDFTYVVICFDKLPLTVVKCDKFILMSDLLQDYAEWGGFDPTRLSYCHFPVILDAQI